MKFYVAFPLSGKEGLETLLSSQGLECRRESTVPKEEAHKTTLVNFPPLVTIGFMRESLMLTERAINKWKVPQF